MRLNNLNEGWSELPPIDREKYQERDGLEGPIMTRSGKVVYYDPKEGSYYDPDTDLYISYDDWRTLDNENTHQFDVKSDNSAKEDSNTKYGIVRYPDTSISYIKNDGEGWEHIYDKSYGYSGPVAKGDLKHAKKIDVEKIPSRMFEGRVSDQLIDDSETMSKEEFAKKHGAELAHEYFESVGESSNPAMDRALRQIEKTFGPERKAISDKITVLAQAVEMMSKPRWKDRALDHASQLGLNSVEDIKQELELLLQNESNIDDEDVTDAPSNIKRIERTLAKLDALTETRSYRSTASDEAQRAARGGDYKGDGKSHLKDKLTGKELEDFRDKQAIRAKAERAKEKAEAKARRAQMDADYEKISSRMFEVTENDSNADIRARSVRVIDHILKQEGAKDPSIIITDIMHWIDANPGKDFASLVNDAKGFYQDELNESSQEMVSEAQFDEAAGEKDACYRKVKSRYKVWPSAYASGALVKCRKVGAKNWGNSKK